jgi:hypothetical protein
MNTATNLLVGQLGKTASDLVLPGTAGWVRWTCQRGRFGGRSRFSMVLWIAWLSQIRCTLSSRGHTRFDLGEVPRPDAAIALADHLASGDMPCRPMQFAARLATLITLFFGCGAVCMSCKIDSVIRRLHLTSNRSAPAILLADRKPVEPSEGRKGKALHGLPVSAVGREARLG